MAAATVTSLNAIHKILYANGDLPKQVMYAVDPFFAEVRKNTKFGGNSIAFPLQFRGGANTGSTVALAQTNTAPNGYSGFVIPASARKQRHGVAQWERQAIRATIVSGDRGAFVRGYQREVDGQSYALARDLAKDLWGTGGMALGQVGSGQGTPTITLLDVDSIVNFEVNMVVGGADADPGTTGAGTIRVGTATIIGVNRALGQLTVTGNWTASIAALAANDFLFQAGDIVAGDYAVGGRGLRGVPAWTPLTAPSATPFFNVDRTQDSTRLGGYRLDCRGLTIEEAIRQLGLFLAREGGRANRVYLSMKNWHKFMNEGAARTVIQVGPTGGNGKLIFGYNAVEVVTSAGTVKVVAGANVPNDRIFMLNLADWELASLDECPTVVKDDGLNFVRQTTANIFELRLVYDAALICYNPGSQAVGQVNIPTL